MSPVTRRAAIYCRISRDRIGAGLGVERQEVECRELAARLGWTVSVVYVDNDISAYSGKARPGYRALLEDLKAGRVNAVISWHTDRLHRSPVELETYIAVCEARGAPTHCVKAGELDLTTPSGRLVARQLGSVARYEVEHTIERIRGEKAEAARAGRYRGSRRPFGFQADGVTVAPTEAALVLDASRRVLHGETLSSIAREWNQRGVLTTAGSAWTSVAVRRVLLRARNAGYVEHQGVEVGPACWPAIVSPDVWRAVRVLCLDPARRTQRGTDPAHLGSGLYLCGECGASMRMANRGGGSGSKCPTYRCRAAAHLSRAAAPIDELVTELVLARLSRPDARLLLATRSGIDTAALVDEEAALRVRQRELVDLFVAGAITKADVAAGRTRISQRLTELATEMAAAAAGSPLAGFADAPDVAAVWAQASVSRRKAVVDALMTITLDSPGQGARTFDPASVQVEWRRD